MNITESIAALRRLIWAEPDGPQLWAYQAELLAYGCVKEGLPCDTRHYAAAYAAKINTAYAEATLKATLGEITLSPREVVALVETLDMSV